MSLKSEIAAKSKGIKTDSYKMSIGEIVNLYRDGEIDVHPEFQRIFRWSDYQKTRLIESILLGIPLPSIFVSQRKDGVWDLIDGVQRISTILQFMGLLKDIDGALVPPLVLENSEYLPSLNGMTWKPQGDKGKSFSKDEQLYIKRAKLDMVIIQKESDQQAKYELFMRLNTGGSKLEEQEVRNCLLVMTNPEMFHWLKELSADRNFLESLGLSDRSVEQQDHMELAYRFLIFRKMPVEDVKEIRDINDFLDKQVRKFAEWGEDQRKLEAQAFRYTFQHIASACGSDAFKRYDTAKDRYTGGFLISAFETVALGIGFYYQDGFDFASVGSLPIKIKSIWSADDFVDNSGSGVRASSRLPKLIPFGRRLFQP